jgi:glutathione S-transferase
MVDAIWLEVRKQFFDTLPPVLKQIVSAQVRRGVRKALYSQGMGRHNRDDIYELGNADLSALSSWLGRKPYFMGNVASSLDATAYAFLANILVPPFDSPLKAHAMSLGNLSPYCERMREQLY